MNFTAGDDEEAEALGTPLLAAEQPPHSEVGEFGAQLREYLRNNNSNSCGMVAASSPQGASVSETNSNNNTAASGSGFSSMMMMGGSSSSSSHGHPLVRGTIASCLRIRTVADVLPTMLRPVVANGKHSILFFLGGQMVLFLCWLPFWIVSLVVSEAGVYLGCLFTVVLVGRGILRMIAFPGSSHRVVSEIEKEFTKYSVRVLTSSATSLVEVSEAILVPSNSTHYHYNVRSLWKRANSYRHRVLGVYEEVLRTALGMQQPQQAQHGNNTLVGDIGNLSGLTSEAVSDGRVLLNHLEIVLATVDSLEDQARNILLEQQQASPSERARQVAASLATSATELRNFIESLKPPSASTSNNATHEGDDTEMLSANEMQQHQQLQPSGIVDTIKTGVSAILPMLDPPPHTSIFGFDVLRGCVLSRYKGARQLWIPRPGGGRIDCLHIPAFSKSLPSGNNTTVSNHNCRAVLYCNPNAGLIEVATGISLAGGNVSYETDGVVNDNCWTDFYTNEGFDIYLFNYAGFGRSYGRSAFCGICGREGTAAPYTPGVLGRIKRILYGLIFDFRPTPTSLRADGLAVSNHVLSLDGVESLVIHGESIGGMAASGTARALTESSQRSKVSLLLCDRTFCNLEAVAQRLVGGWSGYAIRMLAPLWSTDVLGDFLAVSCAKVVATDAADAIIADASSLKAGISFWKEIRKSSSSTKEIGWKMDAPLHYKMADWENVGVTGSRYVAQPNTHMNHPVWPSDKHVSIDEAFHFAACAKRIGTLASIEKKRSHLLVSSLATNADADQSGETCKAPIYVIWKYLGCCEGLCGAPLGVAVKDRFDTTVSWLSSVCVFGGQTVLEGMEHRKNLEGVSSKLHELGAVVGSDFDCRPPGYEQQESDAVVHPKPIPEVLENLRKIVEENPNDAILSNGEQAF